MAFCHEVVGLTSVVLWSWFVGAFVVMTCATGVSDYVRGVGEGVGLGVERKVDQYSPAYSLIDSPFVQP